MQRVSDSIEALKSFEILTILIFIYEHSRSIVYFVLDRRKNCNTASLKEKTCESCKALINRRFE